MGLRAIELIQPFTFASNNATPDPLSSGKGFFACRWEQYSKRQSAMEGFSVISLLCIAAFSCRPTLGLTADGHTKFFRQTWPS